MNCLIQVKNGEMKTVMDQQRKRIASHEADVRTIHTKFSQLESLLLCSKKTSAKSKNSIQNDGTCKNGLRNEAFDSVDLEKLVAAEGELLQLRADVLQLAGSFAELSGKDVICALNAVEKESVVGCRNEIFGNQTLKDCVTAMGSIEKRLSNFESMNASLVSHIAKLNSQISEQRKSGDERAMKQERELQKRTQQIALLEKQLDEKVQEMTSYTLALNGVKAELEQSKADCETARKELDVKREECQRAALDVTRLKELHAEHCVELAGQIGIVEREREEMRSRLEQTETRCRALEQGLSQTIEISDALKDDLHGCRQLQSMVLAMEQEAKEATDRAEELEAELNSLKTELEVQMESAQVVEEDYRTRLEEQSERVRVCEERLGRAEEQVSINEGEITRLLKELSCSQVSLRDGAEKMEAIEHERDLFQAQVSELQQRMKRETSRLESALDIAEEKLEEASQELTRRDQRIAELTRKDEDVRLERARVEGLFSKLEESDKLRREMELELEKVNGIADREQREIETLRVMLKEREAAIEDLQGRVVRAYKELQEKMKIDKHSFAEVEQLKAEAHTRDSQLAEATRKAELKDGELKSCRDQLDSVQSVLTQCMAELQRNRLEIEGLNEKLAERECDEQQKASKIKQLEQMLNERLSVLTESEQRRLRFEGALQKNQLDAEQYEKQVSGLEDQLHDLLALVKEQCLKIQKGDAASARLRSEVDGRNARVKELERTVGNLEHELKRAASVNVLAEQELCSSREHLQKMQNEVINARQDLTSLRLQHDRLAKDLAEAVALLQQKDLELSKLLETLSVAEEFRSRYSDQVEQSEKAFRSLKESYHRDLHHLKKVHEEMIAVRESENQSLRQDLVASNEQQRQLAERVAQLADQIARQEQRERQCSELKTDRAKSVGLRAKGSSIAKGRSEVGFRKDALELSCRSSEASLSDLSIFSNSRSSSDSESVLVKTRVMERGDRPGLPHKGLSTLSGVAYQSSQHGLDPSDRGIRISDKPHQIYSSFTMQQSDDKENDSLSSDYFQTMWRVLLNSETEERAVSGHHPAPCSKHDDSRITMCTPVNTSDRSASTVDHSAPPNNCSAPVNNSSAVNRSDLIVYHLAPCGQRSTSSIDHSNSNQPQKDPCKAHLRISSKSQMPDVPTEPKQFQTPNRKKIESSINTKPRGNAMKPPKNACKRAARTVRTSESPFSPIFANRHSPNPTTAISYYEKFPPTSQSDAEVEKITAGRDIYDGERFSTLSDE